MQICLSLIRNLSNLNLVSFSWIRVNSKFVEVIYGLNDLNIILRVPHFNFWRFEFLHYSICEISYFFKKDKQSIALFLPIRKTLSDIFSYNINLQRMLLTIIKIFEFTNFAQVNLWKTNLSHKRAETINHFICFFNFHLS